MTKLPPMTALRAFEAAARHLSFQKAAAEIHVTPTAVSHQVRLLEEFLGRRLFERRPRQVRLTTAGETLFHPLRTAFENIAAAVAAVELRGGRRRITITATTAFTARWLVPRIARLRQRMPDVNLQLLASEEVVNLSGGDADLAIRYGIGPYQGCAAELLFPDHCAPAFSPELQIGQASELASATLIQFEWRHPTPAMPSWGDWFAAVGLAFPSGADILEVSDELVAIEAAIAGHGVVLVSLPLVQADLEAGRLVAPFETRLAPQAYHLVTSPDRKSDDDLALVCQWLREEAEAVGAHSHAAATD